MHARRAFGSQSPKTYSLLGKSNTFSQWVKISVSYVYLPLCINRLQKKKKSEKFSSSLLPFVSSYSTVGVMNGDGELYGRWTFWRHGSISVYPPLWPWPGTVISNNDATERYASKQAIWGGPSSRWLYHLFQEKLLNFFFLLIYLGSKCIGRRLPSWSSALGAGEWKSANSHSSYRRQVAPHRWDRPRWRIMTSSEKSERLHHITHWWRHNRKGAMT